MKQVKAQFGDSSNEIQALGLKKKSEYKSPTKKKNTLGSVRKKNAVDVPK